MTKIEQTDELARLQQALDHANARYDFDVNQLKDQLDQVRRERNAAETELDELKAKPPLSWGATRSYMKAIWDQAGLSERTKLETKTSKHSWVSVFPAAFAEARAATPLVRDMLHLLFYEVLRYQDHTTRLSEYTIEKDRRLADLRSESKSLREVLGRIATTEPNQVDGVDDFTTSETCWACEEMQGIARAGLAQPAEKGK